MKLKNKTLEAWLRGYILFDVNGERYFRYAPARARRLEITGSVSFKGLHIWKGWVCFYLRIVPPPRNCICGEPGCTRQTHDQVWECSAET